MHKYIITRGQEKFVRRWIEDLEMKFVPHPLKDKDGKTKLMNVQLMARPIQLWELIYPEEQDDTVCKMIGDEGYGYKKVMKKLMITLSKLLGLERTKSKADITNIVPIIPRQSLGVHVLGNTKDARDIHGNEML